MCQALRRLLGKEAYNLASQNGGGERELVYLGFELKGLAGLSQLMSLFSKDYGLQSRR